MIVIVKDKDFQYIPNEYKVKLFSTFGHLCMQAEKFLTDPLLTIDASFSILRAEHEGNFVIFKIDFEVDKEAVIITSCQPITQERYEQLTIARKAVEAQQENPN